MGRNGPAERKRILETEQLSIDGQATSFRAAQGDRREIPRRYNQKTTLSTTTDREPQGSQHSGDCTKVGHLKASCADSKTIPSELFRERIPANKRNGNE